MLVAVQRRLLRKLLWYLRTLLIPTSSQDRLTMLAAQGRTCRIACNPSSRRVSAPCRALSPPAQATQQSPQVAPSTSDDDDLRQMAKLSEEEVGLLISREGAMGRGLMADKDVQKQILVSIPLYHSLVVTDNPLDNISVFGDTMLDEWQDVHGAMPGDLVDFIRGDQRWDVRLTAWLLWILDQEGTLKSKSPKWAATAPASLWDLYLHLLPDERDMACLLNFGAEEAQELQAKRLIEEAGVQHDWIVHLHERWFSKNLTSGPKALRLAHGLKETLWASAMVRSRSFSEEVNGEGLTLLVPWADLANHSVDYNSTFGLSRDKECFELRSLQPLSAGEEVLISYGDNKTNAELMRDYGFVIPGNPWDRIPTQPGDDLLSCDSLNQSPEESTRQVQSDEPLPPLNGASLCESSDMEGDWMSGELQAMPDSLDTVSEEAEWERRRCAILSLPLTDGEGNQGGLYQSSSSQQLDQGKQGIWGWAKKGQENKKGPQQKHQPRKLSAAEVQDERVAIARYFDRWASIKSSLPTTLVSDEQLLHEALCSPRRSPAALSSRHRAALRFRIEYKKLLNQGLDMLRRYDDGLAECVSLPGKL